jgi:hypothetical protein
MAKYPHRRPRKRRWPRRILTLLGLVLLAAAFVRWDNTALQITWTDPTFTDLPEGFDGCRFVVLGDVHTSYFGENNEKLFDAVEAEEPEYIFLTGDLLDAFHDVPADYAASIAEGLTDIAPTYYVTGNHEWAIGNVPQLKETLTDCGVTVLTNQFLELERNGDTIVLAGIDDPNGYADQKSPETVAAEVYAAYGDPFWLLLAHRNNLFVNQYSLLGADLVISAHGHGGLVRLPFTDGLIATDHHTLFPSYTAGLYENNGSVLFVTRGLGNTGSTFRLFNRPEVAVLTLHCAFN